MAVWTKTLDIFMAVLSWLESVVFLMDFIVYSWTVGVVGVCHYFFCHQVLIKLIGWVYLMETNSETLKVAYFSGFGWADENAKAYPQVLIFYIFRLDIVCMDHHLLYPILFNISHIHDCLLHFNFLLLHLL